MARVGADTGHPGRRPADRRVLAAVRAAMLLFRFFRIVAPVPALVSGLAAAVLVACAGLALMAPQATSAPLPSLLLAQTPPQQLRVIDTPSDGGGSLTVLWAPSAADSAIRSEEKSVASAPSALVSEV